MSVMLQHRKGEQGFTMVVIAALFIAFAVIAAVAVERNTIVQQITYRDAAAAQLTRLSNAIIESAVFNKSGTSLMYPCPAAITGSSTASGFGSNTATSPCNTGAAPAGTVLYNTDLLQGMVPVTTLSAYGIGANDAFDPWNNRIVYVVNRTMTPGGTPSQTNNATITDQRTGYAVVSPDFILISPGRDGLGAYKRTDNATPSIACTAGTTVLRNENCDNDAAFYTAPPNISPTATAGNNTPILSDYFDDIMTWYRQ